MTVRRERKGERERLSINDQLIQVYIQVQTMINVDNDREDSDMTRRCIKVKGERLVNDSFLIVNTKRLFLT